MTVSTANSERGHNLYLYLYLYIVCICTQLRICQSMCICISFFVLITVSTDYVENGTRRPSCGDSGVAQTSTPSFYANSKG